MPVSISAGTLTITYTLRSINFNLRGVNGPQANAQFSISGAGIPGDGNGVATGVLLTGSGYTSFLASLQGNPTASPPIAPNPCAFLYNSLGAVLSVSFTLPSNVESELTEIAS